MYQAANQLLEKLTVSSQLHLHDGALFLDGDTNSTNASAISVVTGTTFLTSAGAETRTLANGVEGQVKFIICITYGGDHLVVTPASIVGTTLTFHAAGDVWAGVFKKGEWITLFVGGTAAIT